MYVACVTFSPTVVARRIHSLGRHAPDEAIILSFTHIPAFALAGVIVHWVKPELVDMSVPAVTNSPPILGPE